MIELRELNLAQNQIKCVEGLHSYPKLEELNLSDNPIVMIFPNAFKSNESMETLILDNIKLKWPKDDLVFLKKLENSLNKLSLNNAFPKKNLDDIDVFNMCKLPYVDELSLQNVGLVSIVGISKIFPSLTILDLTNNKIFSVNSVEELHKLPQLSEVSFKDNPLCAHKHLIDMVRDVVPEIENVNNNQLHEPGFRYKE